MIEGFNNQAPTVVCRAVFAVIRKTGAVISVLDRKLGESSKALRHHSERCVCIQTGPTPSASSRQSLCLLRL